jgi:hypothetical protein
MVVGARHTGLSVSRSASGIFHAQQFPCVSRMIHHPKDIQPTGHNCGKDWSQTGPASMWKAFNTLYSPCVDKCMFCSVLKCTIKRIVPIKSLDTPTHSRVFLYFLKLFSTLQNNSDDIKTMKWHIWNHVVTKKVLNKFFKVATLCLDDSCAHSWHSLHQLHKQSFSIETK